MAVTTMTVVDALLKEIYEEKLQDQLQSEINIARRIHSTSEGVTSDVGGKYVVFPLRTSRNHGIGGRNENEALPIPRTSKFAAARVSLAYLYGGVQLTGQTFELADTNKQAFLSALEAELDGLKEGLAKDMSRQFFGTAIGKLCTSNASGSTTTLKVSDAEAIYLEQDMYVDLYDNTDTLHTGGTSLQITSLVSASGTTTVTFTPAVTGATASGEYFVRTGGRARETIGLSQIISTSGILYNVDPATVQSWTATVNSNGGTNRALSEGLMIKVADDIRRRGGGQPTLIACNLGVRRQYFNLLSQQRQFVNTQEFTGGFKGLAFTTDKGDIPVISDLDCPWNRMEFINEKVIKFYQVADWKFMNRDGSNWQRVFDSTGDYDAYKAMMFKYCQMGTHRRNAHGRLADITE